MKRIRLLCAVLAVLSALASVATATTFTVTSTADSGIGTLRNAINLANADALAPVVIQFNIPTGGGVALIRPFSPLPVIQNINGLGIKIDGYTQPGSSYTPGSPAGNVVMIELDGSLIPVPYVAPPLPAPQYAHGIYIMSSSNRVQGLCVHGFPHDGISIQGIPVSQTGGPSGSNFNEIFWNLVGTDPTGLTAKPNGREASGLWGGIYVKVVPQSPGVANQNWILENVSSGNMFEGIGISNCPPGDVQRNHVERCYVGLDITGTGALGNGHDGIYIGEAAHDNVLDQNWICANSYEGVGIVGYAPTHLSTYGNLLIGNRIGVDVNLNAMGNKRHGVGIGCYGGGVWGWAPKNTLQNNVIAYNNMAGVVVQEDTAIVGDNDSSFNTFTQNAIHHNGTVIPGYLGIDLAFEPGVTANDPGDPDPGPNELLNFPVITSATYAGGTTTVTGTVDVPAFPVTIEFFRAVPDATGTNHGQGAVYLGAATTILPNWTVALTTAAPGQLITATTTDSSGNTSEFSLNAPVGDGSQNPYDFGDAPDQPYPTLSVSNGARHKIVAGMYLGFSVDGDPDGQPDATATGDDTDGNDDEDGVAFPVLLVPGQPCQIDITASMAGLLDAWIDFNGDGTWAVGVERILTSALHTGGGVTISYPFTVPAGAKKGNTFVRVRYSSAGGLLPTGLAGDGEVEDHLVTITSPQEQLDFGDAPDQPYPTLLASNGARHKIMPGYGLGTAIDGEPNGQPNATATGDDINNLADEDGVYFYPLILGGSSAIDVTASAPGMIDAWIDFNNNGSWLDAGEQIAVSVPVNAGLTQIVFPVPAAAMGMGMTYARVRFSSMGGLLPTGLASDGEVEDYAVFLMPPGEAAYDFGDAPDPSYPTLMASFGAAHIPDGLYLGPAVDTESDGQPHPNALGDDLAGIDDEDGVVFAGPMIGGTSCNVIVMASAPGFLDAWIDFEGDGSWAQPGNQIANLVPLMPGPNMLTVSVPATGAPLRTFARFRASHSGTSWTGFCIGGEVEDYQVSIGCRIQARTSVTFSPLTLVLNWPATPGASFYTVYSSTTLASPFPAAWMLETPVPPGVVALTWSELITVPRKFYQVVAWP